MTGDDEGRARGTADDETSTNESAENHQDGSCDSTAGGPRQCHGDTIASQLRRRRYASLRLPPLESGDIRDPYRSQRTEKLSAKQLEAVVAAAEHLNAAGLSPVFDADVLRGLWRAGDRS